MSRLPGGAKLSRLIAGFRAKLLFELQQQIPGR